MIRSYIFRAGAFNSIRSVGASAGVTASMVKNHIPIATLYRLQPVGSQKTMFSYLGCISSVFANATRVSNSVLRIWYFDQVTSAFTAIENVDLLNNVTTPNSARLFCEPVVEKLTLGTV